MSKMLSAAVLRLYSLPWMHPNLVDVKRIYELRMPMTVVPMQELRSKKALGRRLRREKDTPELFLYVSLASVRDHTFLFQK